MSATSTVLPPDIVLSPSAVYASLGSVYALEASSGTLGQRYAINGLACPTVVHRSQRGQRGKIAPAGA